MTYSVDMFSADRNGTLAYIETSRLTVKDHGSRIYDERTGSETLKVKRARNTARRN